MLKNIIITLLISSLFFISACSATSSNNAEENNERKASEEVTAVPHEEIEIKAPDTDLQKKDEGEQVEQLQLTLNEIGYDLSVTGIYDDTTTWAITDFQLQHDDLLAIGVYNEETKEILEEFLDNEKMIESGSGLPQVDETATTDSGTKIIANPYDLLALVNKEHALPEDYEPEDMVIPDVRFPFTEELPKKQMREVAADALEEMFQAADEEGLELYAQSGYRSFERQDAIFASNVSVHGEEEANTFSARPGESEHQSGLTMDVTSPDVAFQLIQEFGETAEGKWIKQHAQDFGFIIRYPEGKEDITLYEYEPWHLRYIGEKAAKEIMEHEITLEEYLGE